MINVHPAYYSHYYENQLISWAVALFGSTTLLTVATNFTNPFFRQAGFVELAEVCKEGTQLGPEKHEKADCGTLKRHKIRGKRRLLVVSKAEESAKDQNLWTI
jgi:hypothetical protein